MAVELKNVPEPEAEKKEGWFAPIAGVIGAIGSGLLMFRSFSRNMLGSRLMSMVEITEETSKQLGDEIARALDPRNNGKIQQAFKDVHDNPSEALKAAGTVRDKVVNSVRESLEKMAADPNTLKLTESERVEQVTKLVYKADNANLRHSSKFISEVQSKVNFGFKELSKADKALTIGFTAVTALCIGAIITGAIKAIDSRKKPNQSFAEAEEARQKNGQGAIAGIV